jgi:HEAT repeat protein
MRLLFHVCFAVLFCFPIAFFGQIPSATLIQIVKAEDERRFDDVVENLLKNPVAKIRARAALAAGRIGDERALPALVSLLEKDSDSVVRATSAFAIGEIESVKGAGAIVEALKNRDTPNEVRARVLEAAGKIAAAVAQPEKQRFDVGRSCHQTRCRSRETH